MQAIKKKLRSRRGASLTFALLIFLVCTVVGAVVLAAATAASGRMSRLTEMDQRYFSVTSAADLLAQELSNKKVSIVRTQTYVDSVSTVYTPVIDATTEEETLTEGIPVSSTSEREYSTKINEETISVSSPLEASKSFLTKQAVKLMFGEKNCNTEPAFAFSLKKGNANNGEFTLSHSGNDDLNINGTYQLKADGTLILKLKDTIVFKPKDNQEEEDHYTLKIVLKPHIREWPDSKTEKLPPEYINNESDSGYTKIEKEQTTLYKYSEIYWTLSSVSTGDE